MNLYDFDGMFDKKLADYISKNRQKYTESEWEDVIPKLYNKFGDTAIKSLGKTPRRFYAEMSDEELVKQLKAHLKQGVPVSDFLCKEIESRDMTESLTPLLDGTADERDYAINLIGSNDSVIKKYLDILVETDDGDLKDRCADFIKEKADLVIDEVLSLYRRGIERELMLEIMSRCVLKRDDVFEILVKEFRCDDGNVPLNAGYLAAYGDERALPVLLDKIDEEGISFIEYQELKYAIESLGGEYKKERDFSNDPYYALVKAHSVSVDDLLDIKKKN